MSEASVVASIGPFMVLSLSLCLSFSLRLSVQSTHSLRGCLPLSHPQASPRKGFSAPFKWAITKRW